MKSKKTRARNYVSLFLLFALSLGAVVPLGAQESRRERRVAVPAATPSVTPSATARPTPSVRPTATPEPPPTFVPAPLPEQTPTATPAPTPVTPATRAVAPQTVEELRARIGEVMRRPVLASSQVAVKVASLDTGRVVFEENAGKWMQPASNMKIYTVAAALDRLGPEFRFTTSVYAPARPDATGAVRGDLVVYGRGDPTFATRFNDGDYFKAIDEFAARIVAAGVRRVEGDLVGDESYFTGLPLAPGWEWDDLQWYYGAEISALSVNDNSVDLSVKPGAQVGSPCVVTIGPATTLVRIFDRTTTAPRGTPRSLVVYRPLGENVIEVSGSLPLDDAGFAASVAISRPAMLFVSMLRASLERRGVQITGGTRTVDARARAGLPAQISTMVEIASRQSPPLGIVAAQTMKPSQNLYTELILRALGKAAASPDPRRTTDEAGIEAVQAFLRTAGGDSGKHVMIDGSGLSRGNLVTAANTLQLLTYMSRHRYSGVWRDSMPVAGVDGTLRTRMRGTAAAGNVRAKTGTLSSATSLSGYVTSAAGERLVFSLMINNPPPDADPRRDFTDAIAVLLASFTGRT